jgi:thiamine biosynthesis lipoprotein
MALACAVLAPCLAGAGEGVTREVYSMGTRLRLSVWANDRPTAVDASESALVAIEAVEARLSTWRQGTELDRLNHSAARGWFSLSAELARDLAEAGRWWRETGGAFDPGLTSLVEAWDLRGMGRRPSAGDLERAKSSAGFRHLELEGTRARRLAEGFGVEEGGFGKGIALRDAAAAAKRAGAVCAELDLGGQILLSGACAERVVGVADPRRRDRVVAELSLRSGSVATSGSSERYVEIDGLKWGHILDPVTGQPVEGWGSVTVIADDPVAADCLATALFVMGPERGLEWAARRSDVEAVFAVVEGSDIRLISTAMAARAGSNG